MTIVALYVDDLIIAFKDPSSKEQLVSTLSKSYEIEDLGSATSVLGIRISKDSHYYYSIDQQYYIEATAAKHGLSEAKPRSTPLDPSLILEARKEDDLEQQNGTQYRSLVGELAWISTATRPDITFAVNKLSRYLQNPSRVHMRAAQSVLNYLQTTRTRRITYSGTKDLCGYTDSDYGADIDTRRSTAGYVFLFAGGAITWKSQLQTMVTLSITKKQNTLV